MPIVVSHGPIGAALQLARRGGEGERFWRTFQAEQDVYARMQRDEQLDIQRESQRAQLGLQYGRLAQQERQAQETLAQRRVETEARGVLTGQREARAARGEARTEADRARQERIREQFKKQFGMEPEMFSPAIQQKREERIVAGAKSTKEYRAADNRAKTLQDELKRAVKKLDRMTDPLSKKFGDYVAASGVDKGDYTKTYADVMHALPRRIQEAERNRQGVLDQAMSGLPQYGREAAQRMLPGAQVDQAAMIQQKAGIVAQAVAGMLGPASMGNEKIVCQAVLTYLVQRAGADPDDPDVKQFVDLVVSMILGGR